MNTSLSAMQASAASSFNDDPYSIELDKLDVFNIVENDQFMGLVIEAKKNLIEEAKVMRRLFQLDTFSLDSEKVVPNKSKEQQQKVKSKSKETKKVRRRIVDDEDDEMIEIEMNANTEGAPNKDAGEHNKADDEESEEEEPLEEELEEVIYLLICF